jgi:hypothetical protein
MAWRSGGDHAGGTTQGGFIAIFGRHLLCSPKLIFTSRQNFCATLCNGTRQTAKSNLNANGGDLGEIKERSWPLYR